jgi:hypothetical protein
LRFTIALAVACSLAIVAHGQESKPDTAAMRCQAQLTLIRADVIDGRLLELQAVKAKIEAANPGQTIDPATFKLAPVKPVPSTGQPKEQ